MRQRLASALVICSLVLSLLTGTVGAWPVVYAADPDTDAIAQHIQNVRSLPPVYSDHFRVDDGSWDTAATDVVFPYYQAGALHFYLNDTETVGYCLSQWEAGDFYLDVDSYHVSGPLDNSFGVIFRYVDELNFYYFSVSSDGYYAFYRFVDGEWDTLIAWTESDAITTGEGSANWLGVEAVGSQITLIANDYILDVIEDDTFAYGRIGLAAESIDEPDVEVAFDDLSLWDAIVQAFVIVDAPTVTPTPGPTFTPAPTALPTALPTSVPTGVATTTSNEGADVTAIRRTQPTYAEDFGVDSGDWPVGSDEYGSATYQDGMLHMLVTGQNTVRWSVNSRTYEPEVSDFYAEVDLTDVAGPPDSENGFVFRFQDAQNFYLFSISGAATYSLHRKLNGEWQTLIPWSDSPVLQQGNGARNRLGVLAQGATIAVFANDQQLATVQDSALAQGGVGLIAGAFEGGDVEVAFDNFKLWRLDGAAPSVSGPTAIPSTTPAPNTNAADALSTVAAIRQKQPTYAYDLDSFHDDWSFGSNRASTTAFDNGRVHVRVLTQNGLAYFGNHRTFDSPLADFYAEVEMMDVASPDSEGGIIFRHENGDNYYFFGVSNYGTYTLEGVLDGEWKDFLEWDYSPALQTGKNVTNRIGVLAQGQVISFVANDQILATLNDSSFAQGGIALAVGSFDEAGVEIAFDNFKLWSLDSAAAPTPTSEPAATRGAGVVQPPAQSKQP